MSLQSALKWSQNFSTLSKPKKELKMRELLAVNLSNLASLGMVDININYSAVILVQCIFFLWQETRPTVTETFESNIELSKWLCSFGNCETFLSIFCFKFY